MKPQEGLVVLIAQADESGMDLGYGCQQIWLSGTLFSGVALKHPHQEDSSCNHVTLICC